VNRAQRRLVDPLVDEGHDQPRTDRQLYNTLFELLHPTSKKGQGPATENLMLVVDPAASTIPFELLAARGLEETPVPLAVETGMMRRLETTTFRESVRPAAGVHALVIGDPSGVAQRLPGAREEARRVAAKLSQHGFQVTAVIPESETDMSADVTRIMNALFRHDYRIIHIAAHGTYASESDNGILIGKDILLSAQEIRQMRATPDLVFLNACHAGSILLRRRAAGQGDQEPPTNAAGRLAASISRQLIDDGVRGVVAAGWAVDDDAAASFAETFYDGLLGRLDLGDATRQARAAIYHAFPAVNTWGAYQVYGPPAMRIHVAGTGSADGPDVVSRKQFRSRLADLQSRADDATDDQQADIESALRQALGSVPQEWMGGSELYAEADVWFRLGNYEKAIGRYTDALREWEGKAPLKLVEQLVNAKVKQAQQDPGRTDLFDEAASLIEALRLLGAETPERRALEGSYLRRRAAASPPELRPALLEQARTAYRAADQMYQAKHGRSGFYFGLNWVLLDWLLTRREEPDVPTLLRIIESCEQDAAAQACADFWCRTTAADAALARALVTDSLAGERTAIAEAYLKVFRSGSSRRERMAITEHIRILRSFLDEDGTIAAALEDIEATLSAPLGAAREPSRG
jgi:CHAT domain-containing protein